MKNLLIFLLLILIIGCNKSPKVGLRTVSGTGTGWQQVTKKQNFKDSTYFTKSVSTVYGDLKNSQVGAYNVLDYGAISDDGVADQTAIQAAVNDAAAYGTEPQGGTVIIPAGKWYITDSVELASYISIEVDKNAFFYFPNGYKKSMWHKEPGVILAHTTIDGGYYGDYFSTRTWNCIDLESSNVTTGYATFNRFDNIRIQNCNIAINLNVTATGWINGNNFTNIMTWTPVEWLKTRQAITGNGLTGNVYNNCSVQPALAGVSTFAIDSLCGLNNIFTNLYIWDDSEFTNGIVLNSSYTTIIAAGISKAKFKDIYNYTHNFVMSNGSVLSGTIFDTDADTVQLGDDVLNMAGGSIYDAEKIIIHGANTSADTTNKLIIAGNNAIGTTGVPAGPIALAFRSYQPYASSYATANTTARIGSMNEAGSNYAAWLFFDVHGPANAPSTYTTAMKISPYGGIIYPFTNTGGLGAGIATDALSRMIYYDGGSAVDLSANPQIADGYDGQIITIVGKSDTNTLTLDDGSGLALSAQFVMGVGDCITLVYHASLDLWVEISRSNN